MLAPHGQAENGISLFESLLALALTLFVILAIMKSQIWAFSTLNSSQRTFETHRKLFDWETKSINDENCAKIMLPGSRNALKCSIKNEAINKEDSILLLLD